MIFKNIFKKNNTEFLKANKFWHWFNNNQNRFLFLSDVTDEEKDKLMNEFLIELHKFNDSIYFEIGGHKDDEKVELIISAEGNKEYFPTVELLTSCSPQYKNWNVIAFKPPMGKGFSLNYGDKVFNPEEIIFIPLSIKQNPNAVGFNVCYPDFDESIREVFINGTYLILDTIIGEKSAVLDIEYMDIIKTPENISDFDFGHLCDIAEYIEERKTNDNNK